MQGLFRRLFAPRWQHPRADIRRQALDQLDPERADQRRALEALGDDRQADIRLAALCRLEDLDALLRAFFQQRDTLSDRHDTPTDTRDSTDTHTSTNTDIQAWRDTLARRLSGRDGQHDLATRQARIGELDDTPLLIRVALEGDNLDLRLTALQRLSAEDDLIHQACHNRIAAVRRVAAERVTSEAGLKRLQKESRRDRHVTRLAREQLNRLKADAQWANEQQQRRTELLERLEQHARAVWDPAYDARLRHIKHQWEALSQRPDADQEARYQQALQHCDKTLHDHAADEHAREQQVRRQHDADQERETLLNALETALDDLGQSPAPNAQTFDSLRAQRQLAGQRWQALSDTYPPSDAINARYASAIQRYERDSAAWLRYLDAYPELETALDNDDTAALDRLGRACQWPDDLPRPALLAQARSRLDARQRQDVSDAANADDSRATLEQALDRLEKQLGNGAFTEANRLHQWLKPRIDALPRGNGNALGSRLKHLGARLAELRDWRGFVAGPKREQLCDGIEALADNTDLADAALDRRHRQLIKEWKALGNAAATRTLSHRFRTASERIHERLAPWRERLDQQRDANLAARQALCDQLEMLLEQPADNADPDALRQIRDRSRQQWRDASPVPRRQADATGRRFTHLRHRLQALIDRRARDIAAHKRNLVEQADILAANTQEPLDDRIAQAKALQRQWRELGRAPKGDEQTLWHAFRSACDRLFAERDAYRHERAEHQQQRLAQMQTLIDRLDAWQPDSAADVDTLDAWQQEAAALEPLPRGRRSDGMRKRLDGIVRQRRERLAQLETDAVITRWQQSIPLLNAHLDADQQALEGGPAQDVAARQTPDTPLTSRLNEAHQRRNASRQAAANLDADSREQQRQRLDRLRVHLSLLATGQVHQDDEPLRLAIQVERLNHGIHAAPHPADELSALLADLLALGPMPRDLWDASVNDLDGLVHRLASDPAPATDTADNS